MRLIRTEKQKDNVAKFVYDVAKTVFTVIVITPLATDINFDIEIVGGGFAATFFFFASIKA